MRGASLLYAVVTNDLLKPSLALHGVRFEVNLLPWKLVSSLQRLVCEPKNARLYSKGKRVMQVKLYSHAVLGSVAQAKLRRLCPAARPPSPSVQSPSWISLKITSFLRFKCLCLCHAKIHLLFQLNFGWGPTVLTSYHLFCLSDSFTVMGCCTSCKKAQLVQCKNYIMLGRVASPLRVLNWVVYPLRITCAVSLGQSVPLCRMPGQFKDCKESCGVSAAFARDLPH